MTNQKFTVRPIKAKSVWHTLTFWLAEEGVELLVIQRRRFGTLWSHCGKGTRNMARSMKASYYTCIYRHLTLHSRTPYKHNKTTNNKQILIITACIPALKYKSDHIKACRKRWVLRRDLKTRRLVQYTV